MPDTLAPAQISPRESIGWREWAALVLAVALGFGIWHTDTVSGRAQAAADQATSASLANREIGFRNRAAVCDFIREFGGVEPRQCSSSDIAAFRDPRIHPGEGERRNTTQLLCLILATLKTPASQCAGAG